MTCWAWYSPALTVQMYVPSSGTLTSLRVRDTFPSSTARAGSTLDPFLSTRTGEKEAGSALGCAQRPADVRSDCRISADAGNTEVNLCQYTALVSRCRQFRQA